MTSFITQWAHDRVMATSLNSSNIGADSDQKSTSSALIGATNLFSFSRASPTGSIDLLTSSSAQNTDDEDSDHKSTVNIKETRRQAHTQAEQKRRDAIKKGYEDLQSLVPTCQPQQQQLHDNGYKLSKATVLQRSIDYIHYLLQQKKTQEDELNTLRKELVALQIMKTNYEQIIKTHQHQAGAQGNVNQISDEIKFQLFQAICDSLFETFDKSLSVSNFAKLSGTVIQWLEEYCKPQRLQDMVLSILRQVNQ